MHCVRKKKSLRGLTVLRIMGHMKSELSFHTVGFLQQKVKTEPGLEINPTVQEIVIL